MRRVLSQREIGAWVLDEAHCLSKWGHHFRPDYRYAGRFSRHHPIHQTIATLQPGDPLTLKTTDRGHQLVTPSGTVVGRLARSYTPPPNTTLASASVAAIVCRNRADSEADCAHTVALDTWEVVIPEFTYTP